MTTTIELTSKQKYYQNNKEKFIQKAKDWADNNKDRRQEIWTKCNRSEKQRLNRFKHRCLKFGITMEIYKEMFDAQNGVCKICSQSEIRTYQGEPMMLCIDHDHKTNKVRSLLCSRCNTSIGKMEESVELLEKAIQYLKDHS